MAANPKGMPQRSFARASHSPGAMCQSLKMLIIDFQLQYCVRPHSVPAALAVRGSGPTSRDHTSSSEIDTSLPAEVSRLSYSLSHLLSSFSSRLALLRNF